MKNLLVKLLEPFYFRTLMPWLDMAGLILYGFGKNSTPAPDYSSLAAASEKAAVIGKQLGEEQIAESKRQYDQSYATAKPVIDQQLQLMNQQQQQGDDYYNYMKQYSRPLETSLYYQSLGLNPDEIKQIQDSYSADQAAANAKAEEQAKAQATSSPSVINVPTYSVQSSLPDGAIKGSDIKTPIGAPTLSNLLNQPSYDANSYYVKNADGSYKLVNPSYTTVQGTQQVTVPGQTQTTSASVSPDYTNTTNLVTQLAAKAGLRAQNEAADQAIADSRAGSTNATNMAIRQGLRYGMSSSNIADATANQDTQLAEQQAGLATAARDKAKNTLYAKQLDVAGLYKNLPGAASGAYGLTLNSGNSAVDNSIKPGAQYQSGMAQGVGTIQNGLNSSINGYGNIVNSQTSAFNAQSSANSGAWGALGTIAGVGLKKYLPTA